MRWQIVVTIIGLALFVTGLFRIDSPRITTTTNVGRSAQGLRLGVGISGVIADFAVMGATYRATNGSK
jgi:hypothetical protein